MLEGSLVPLLMNENTHCRDTILVICAGKAMGHCLPWLGRKIRMTWAYHPDLIHHLSLSLKDWLEGIS